MDHYTIMTRVEQLIINEVEHFDTANYTSIQIKIATVQAENQFQKPIKRENWLSIKDMQISLDLI